MSPVLTIFSALSFAIYGLLCLLTKHMVDEFERYGLSRFRRLVGALELLGGVGLFVGFLYSPLITIISSGGLGLLMLLGVIVRTRVNDSLWSRAPAALLMVLNFYLFYEAIYYN